MGKVMNNMYRFLNYGIRELKLAESIELKNITVVLRCINMSKFLILIALYQCVMLLI